MNCLAGAAFRGNGRVVYHGASKAPDNIRLQTIDRRSIRIRCNPIHFEGILEMIDGTRKVRRGNGCAEAIKFFQTFPQFYAKCGPLF